MFRGFNQPTIPLSMDDEHEPKSLGPPIRLRRRLGVYSIVILVGGYILILGCIGFISFLFWHGNESNPVWCSIVLSGWVTRSITITAFVLRVVIAAQAAVATSMVASLLLHANQTKLSSLAAVSIACFANTGPIDLVRHLHRRVTWVFYLVVGSLVVTSVSLQLTSTLLLSGVVRRDFALSEHLANLNYGITAQSLFSVPRETVGYLVNRRGPTAFPAYAEYSEPVGTSEAREAIRDTGRSIRAFLPIPTQAQREALFVYEGMATALDTRVVCMRPSVQGLRIFSLLPGNKINGTIWTDHKVKGQRVTEATRPLNFSCPYVLIDKTGRFTVGDTPLAGFADWDEEWPISLCSLDMYNSSIRSDMRSPRLPEGLFPPQPMKLLVHSTGPYSAWNTTGEVDVTKLSESNEWLVAETSRGSSLRMTLCTSDVVAQDIHMRGARGFRHSEPLPLWRPEKAVYDVQSILDQLGIGKQIPLSLDPYGLLARSYRGIFDMRISQQQPPNATSFGTHGNSTSSSSAVGRNSTLPQQSFVMQALADLSLHAGGASNLDPEPDPNSNNVSENRGTLYLCVYCTDNTYGMSIGTQLSPVPAAIFQGALRLSSGNAAVAVQALLTTALALTYYDLADRFDEPAPAEIKSWIQVDRPVDQGFAIAVVVLLAVHMLAVAAAVAGFALAGGDSLLGSAWAAVRQVRGPQVDSWLERKGVVGRLRDSEIARKMKEKGQAELLARVREPDGERVRRRRKR